MATITPYKNQWRALIRRVGFKFRSKVFPTYSQAEKWAREIENQMDTKNYVPPTGMKARTVFEKFRDEVSPTRKGEKWETTRINWLLRNATWMDKKLEDVDRFDIQSWRDDRLTSVQSASVNREMNVISGVINYAMREWGIVLRVNPVHEVKRPPKGKSRRRRVSKVEFATLRKSFDFDINRPPRKDYGSVKDSVPWAFLLATETGMRIGELTELLWGDVSFTEHWVHIRESKNGDDRYVPLTEHAQELLVALRSDDAVDHDRVFPVNKGSFDTTYRRWRDDEGIVNLNFHDTRHEAASNLAKILKMPAGIPLCFSRGMKVGGLVIGLGTP